MNIKYISIGFQCTSAEFLRKNKLHRSTYPFDWMLSTPKFVYEILEMILSENANIEKIVKEHFFLCDKKATIDGLEHFYEDPNGTAFLNSKYNAIFPHEISKEDAIEKYIRRCERLKNDILDTSSNICFIYTSQSSTTGGNYTINNYENILNDVYVYLNKICSLVEKYRSNYAMVLFDAIQNEDTSILNKKIRLCKLVSMPVHMVLYEQMNNYSNIFPDYKKDENNIA